MAGSERATRSATDREVARWQAKTSAEPRVAQHWVNLADALMQKSRETLDPGYYALAEAAAKEGLERDPGSSDAMTSLAWIAGSRHEFASSIRWATKALRVSPRNHLALGLIGDAEVEMGDLEKAAQTYQKMLDLKPDASALSRVAHLEFLRGNADRACRLMAKAVEAGSPFAENTAWCRAQLAGMLNQVGYREDAEAILLDALRRAPGNYHVLAGLGMVYRSKGDRTRAIANFEAAEKIAPRHETLAALEALYRDSGDVARRKVKANQIEANHRLLRDAGVKGDSQMALYLAERGERLPEALRLAEAEYRVLKGISSAHAAAWCRFKTGDHSGAVQAIRAALRHGTPDPKLFAHAAEIFRSAGDSRQATLYWTRAERMDPSVLVRVRLAHSPDKADASL
jgi:tetratricopeptide (TPR) repeat protein